LGRGSSSPLLPEYLREPFKEEGHEGRDDQKSLSREIGRGIEESAARQRIVTRMRSLVRSPYIAHQLERPLACVDVGKGPFAQESFKPPFMPLTEILRACERGDRRNSQIERISRCATQVSWIGLARYIWPARPVSSWRTAVRVALNVPTATLEPRVVTRDVEVERFEV
jgi:hypothetical protein